VGQGMSFGARRGSGQGRGLSWYARFLVLAGLCLTMACQPIYSLHGYAPTDEDLALLKVGADTRDSVGVTIGRPSASGLLNDQAWYYVQSRWKSTGGREPEELTREVVAISFDDQGVVQNIERFGLDRGRIVPLSRRVTTTNIRGKGILAQIFGNIGKLNTDSIFK
jgi:outer membrane protein assembly factor BamE (lipoprotein component of BamABCDE complex)